MPVSGVVVVGVVLGVVDNPVVDTLESVLDAVDELPVPVYGIKVLFCVTPACGPLGVEAIGRLLCLTP